MYQEKYSIQGWITIFMSFLIFISACNLFTPEISRAVVGSADRAVEIAKRSRNRVERGSNKLKDASKGLFEEFAKRTVSLQNLIDTRRQLEQAGFLDSNDSAGQARRAHVNSKILVEVAELKKNCDLHLDSLLHALDNFDEVVTSSLVDSQSTRSINTNYEIVLDQYMKKERNRFVEASADAKDALDAYQEAKEPRLKKRLLQKYNRAKRRLLQIEQRRKIYDARIKVAAMNQQISGLIRDKIRDGGHDVPTEFREIMADLYNTFSKIQPVAEIGTTGSSELLAGLGFSSMEEVRSTLEVVDGAINKLGVVLDEMVNDVLSGLEEVKVVDKNGLVGEMLSVEEEMEFLSDQREKWPNS